MAQYNPAADGLRACEAFSFSSSFVLRVILDAPPSANTHRWAGGGNKREEFPFAERTYARESAGALARVEIQPRVRLRFIATIIMILCAVVACAHRVRQCWCFKRSTNGKHFDNACSRRSADRSTRTVQFESQSDLTFCASL